MPDVVLTPTELIVELTPSERLGALRGSIHIPRSAIAEATRIDDPLRAPTGLRSPGLSLPGLVKAGTWRSRGRREFVAVNRRQPALRIALCGQRYDSVLVAVDDPDELLHQLQGDQDE